VKIFRKSSPTPPPAAEPVVEEKSYEELELERYQALAPLEIPGYEIRDIQSRGVAEVQRLGR
jgi:hypothetical protein